VAVRFTGAPKIEGFCDVVKFTVVWANKTCGRLSRISTGNLKEDIEGRHEVSDIGGLFQNTNRGIH